VGESRDEIQLSHIGDRMSFELDPALFSNGATPFFELIAH